MRVGISKEGEGGCARGRGPWPPKTAKFALMRPRPRPPTQRRYRIWRTRYQTSDGNEREPIKAKRTSAGGRKEGSPKERKIRIFGQFWIHSLHTPTLKDAAAYIGIAASYYREKLGQSEEAITARPKLSWVRERLDMMFALEGVGVMEKQML